MDQTFGTKLRQHREQQQISLEAIASDTKIKQSLLDGLERDNLSHWPSGIYRRAYVRTYAKAIHLNPDDVLREFLERHPDPAEVAEAALAALEASMPQSGFRRAVHSALAAVPLFSRHDRSPTYVAAGLQARPGPGQSDQPPISFVAPVTDAESSAEPVLDFTDSSNEPPIYAAALEPVFDVTAQVEAADALVETPVAVVSADASPVMSIAEICGRIARVVDWGDVDALLADASYALEAAGMIVWAWEPRLSTLRPVLAHGYADEVLERMPIVRRDSDSALAAAFRSGELSIVPGAGAKTGAVIVPMLTASACAGMLTIELRDRREEDEVTRALAAILGAQLAALFGGSAGVAQAATA